MEDHFGENVDDAVTLAHIADIEIKYKTAINIMSLKEDGNADILYLSRLKH